MFAISFEPLTFYLSSFRIDHEGTIKVSDFGLSTGLYEKMYFRQEKTDSVKLPIKWMAVESIEDGVFSEKSDVVSQSALQFYPSKISIIS